LKKRRVYDARLALTHDLYRYATYGGELWSPALSQTPVNSRRNRA